MRDVWMKTLIKGNKIMKNFLWAVILLAALAGTGAWAQSTQANPKPQWVLDHEKEMKTGHHSKKSKPVRKVSGIAKRGAKQVSPLVLPKTE